MSDAEKGVPPAERVGPGGALRAETQRGAFAREFWDPRVQSKYWLEAMSQAFDAWMRSIAFLEFMQQGLEMTIAAKRFREHLSGNPDEKGTGRP